MTKKKPAPKKKLPSGARKAPTDPDARAAARMGTIHLDEVEARKLLAQRFPLGGFVVRRPEAADLARRNHTLAVVDGYARVQDDDWLVVESTDGREKNILRWWAAVPVFSHAPGRLVPVSSPEPSPELAARNAAVKEAAAAMSEDDLRTLKNRATPLEAFAFKRGDRVRPKYPVCWYHTAQGQRLSVEMFDLPHLVVRAEIDEDGDLLVSRTDSETRSWIAAECVEKEASR